MDELIIYKKGIASFICFERPSTQACTNRFSYVLLLQKRTLNWIEFVSNDFLQWEQRFEWNNSDNEIRLSFEMI